MTQHYSPFMGIVKWLPRCAMTHSLKFINVFFYSVNTKVDLRFHVMTAQWLPYWIREKLQEKVQLFLVICQTIKISLFVCTCNRVKLFSTIEIMVNLSQFPPRESPLMRKGLSLVKSFKYKFDFDLSISLVLFYTSVPTALFSHRKQKAIIKVLGYT